MIYKVYLPIIKNYQRISMVLLESLNIPNNENNFYVINIFRPK